METMAHVEQVRGLVERLQALYFSPDTMVRSLLTLSDDTLNRIEVFVEQCEQEKTK